MNAMVDSPRGLPGRLPPGEQLLWQGAPDAAALARAAFHARGVAIYFAALTALGLALGWRHGGLPTGALATALCGAIAVGILHLLAWIAARGAVYTLTDRRIVLRIGMALPRSINVPLDRIAAVDLSSGGDVVITLADAMPLGWLMLWPHARPWRLSRPAPALRCLDDATTVANMIARACLAASPHGRVQVPAVAPQPVATATAARPETVAA